MITLHDPTTVLPPIDRPATSVSRTAAAWRRRMRDRRTLSAFSVTAWTAIVAATAVWIWSLGHADLSRIDGYGLLPALPAAWYAALAVLVVIAVVTAVLNAGRSVLLAAGTVAIVLVVHATPALLYAEPRYTWTYKHLGVVNTILAQHAAPRAADIYFDWPGFFTAAGWLSQSTGISLHELAAWSPPFFNILFAAAVSFVARGLTKDLRVVWLTTLLFVITNWVGQDYFAPQPFAFIATLVLTGILLRTTPVARTTSGRLFDISRIRRLIAARRHSGDITGTYGLYSELKISATTRSAVIAVLWLAILTSHQLSPVFAALTTIAIGAARGCIRWRLLAFMIVTEVAWVAYGYPYLSTHNFALLDFNPLHTSSASEINPALAPPGMRLRSYAVYAMYFGMFGLGVFGGLLRVRRGRIDMAPVLVAVSPITMLAVQNYGGEGQLRIYLFAMPYLAFLVAWLLVTLGQYRMPNVRIRAALCAALALGCTAPFLLSYYGQEKVNHVVNDDVAAVKWFYDHGTPGQWLCFVAPNFPSRMTANYIDFPIRSDTNPNLLSSPEFLKRPSIPEAVAYMQKIGGTPYLVFTPSQKGYLEYFGIMTGAEYDRLQAQAATSSRLRLVHRQGQASMWQLVPRRAGK
nr:hypothetical protein [uncultured Actinoplanes sp.]